MKVAIVHPDLGIGGAERLVVDVAVALKKEKNEVLFITNHFDKSHAFDELKQNEFAVKVIGDWIPRSLFGKFQALFAYIRMCFLTIVYLLCYHKQDKPDVYFVDQIPMANFFLKACGKKVIYYCHHPDLLATPHDNLLKKIYRYPIDFVEEKGTKLADVILVNSEYTAKVFKETFSSIQKEVCVLYPTISSSYEEMIKNRKPKRITHLVPEITQTKNVVFLSVNRFHPAKKLELAIEAMENLQKMLSSKQWSEVYLIMAGGYDPLNATNQQYFDELRCLVTKNDDLNGKIIFLKSPSDSLKADLLLSSDCLIYTPVNEHFGIVPLEAMAAGKPVIACNSGGPCETVLHNTTGFLSEPNGQKLAEYMKMFMDKNKASLMGAEGKKRLESLFNYNSFVRQTSKAFNSTILTQSK